MSIIPLSYSVWVNQEKGADGRIYADFRGYTGFQRLEFGDRIQLSHSLAIAWFDGEPTLWVVDGPAGLESLRQYYRDDWGLREIPINTYTPSVV